MWGLRKRFMELEVSGLCLRLGERLDRELDLSGMVLV